jgi:hypothetical protein
MIGGYDFELERAQPDAAALERARDELDDVDGVEVSLRADGGLVSVILGPDEVLERAWTSLVILARAGYAIYDLQRARFVDADEDYESVLQTYEALQRLPGR